LVREADVSPKSFICGGGGETDYEGENLLGLDITELWDFGMYLDTQPTLTPDDGKSRDHGPKNHVSYSFQMPYQAGGGVGRFAADGTRSAAFAVMADKNPWYDPKLDPPPVTADDYIDRVGPIAQYWLGSVQKWETQKANAQPHSRDGQNVLFGDGHSAYEKLSDVGVRHDNIYMRRLDGTEKGIRQGDLVSGFGFNDSLEPRGTEDSFLVNDDELGL
jgi:prepilin-type processing-associated H-X9-DG protein